MNKSHIISEIKRTTAENDGKTLGKNGFTKETGITETHWGKFWASWGEALQEAGFAPNDFFKGYEKSDLVERYLEIAHRLKRLPSFRQLKVERNKNPEFPSAGAYHAHFRQKKVLIGQLAELCRTKGGYGDVLALCESYLADDRQDEDESDDANHKPPKQAEDGCVYMLKSGQFYKIGRSNAAGRREYELSIQLPQKTKCVHVIRTDDPVGIEAYWHKRFESTRQNGEWFALDKDDVAAFKRRKFM